MAKHKTPFRTCIKRLPQPKRGRCFVCGKSGRQEFFDPEASGYICAECLAPAINAEFRLQQAGIARPTTYEQKKRP